MRSQVCSFSATMGKLLPLLVLVALVFINVVGRTSACSDASWQLFKGHFQKQYVTLEEEARRRIIFCDNLQMIHTHNERYEQGKVTYEMGVNQFADVTGDEFRSWLHGGGGGGGSGDNSVVGVLTTNKY